MDEKIFQQEFRKSIKFFNPNCHYVKIPDPSATTAERTIKRPYDAFYIYKEKFIAFEYKMMKSPEGFPFDRVEENQIFGLTKAYQSFNNAYLIINYRFEFTEKQMKKYEIDISKQNFCFCCEILKFLQLQYWYLNFLNSKSLPFEYVWELKEQKSPMILEWTKISDVYVWNIFGILLENT